MSDFVQKEGFGNLFKSDQKGNAAAPGYRGSIMLGGTEYEIAGWVKDGAKGKFFSLSGKVKQEYVKPQAPRSDFSETGSEIPF